MTICYLPRPASPPSRISVTVLVQNKKDPTYIRTSKYASELKFFVLHQERCLKDGEQETLGRVGNKYKVLTHFWASEDDDKYVETLGHLINVILLQPRLAQEH